MRPRPRRGDVYLIDASPVRGREIRKARPWLVVSPDELNDHLDTLIVAPMTSGGHAYSWRVGCRFRRRDGFVVIEEIRAVDRSRLARRLGALDAGTVRESLRVLREMFAD